MAEDIMARHFIDAKAPDAVRPNDFEAFLLHREQALVDEIRHQMMGE